MCESFGFAALARFELALFYYFHVPKINLVITGFECNVSTNLRRKFIKCKYFCIFFCI